MRLWALFTKKTRITYVDRRPLSPSEEFYARHPAVGESGRPFDLTLFLLLHLYPRPLPVSSRRWSWCDGRATAKGKVPVASTGLSEQSMVIGQRP
jgi:hypothetical protein